MKKFITVAILISGYCFAQTNAHLPLKSYSFDFVFISEKTNIDSLYEETGEFHGTGEIYIYSDSITISWSNEWECGTYRLFIDTALFTFHEYGDRAEWESTYTVKSKGYHRVDGYLTLIEGTEIENGRYTHIVFDTNYRVMRRRIYFKIQDIN